MNLSIPFYCDHEYEDFREKVCGKCEKSTYCSAYTALTKGFYNLEARAIIVQRGAIGRECTKFESRSKQDENLQEMRSGEI